MRLKNVSAMKHTLSEAVSMGTVFISELSYKLGCCKKDAADRIRALLGKFSLPVDFPKLNAGEVFDAVIKDKKARTDIVNLVLIEDIGKVRTEPFSRERIGGLIHEMLGN